MRISSFCTLILTAFICFSCGKHYKSSDLFINTESESCYKHAKAFQSKKQLDSAMFYFNKADRLAPNTAVILHERGLLKSDMRNYQEALIDLNKSIELTTDNELKEIRISNRGLTYMQMNKMSDACNDWKISGKWGEDHLKEYCK